MSYTQSITDLANELGITESQAMDVDYLRSLERRLIKIAKDNPNMPSFNVYHSSLEEELEKFEK